MAGPKMLARFICIPPRVTAEDSSCLETMSVIAEEYVGALNAKPIPIKKTAARTNDGEINPFQPISASNAAETDSQRFAPINMRLRSTVSAAAPAGNVNRKKGSAEAVAINES